MPRKATDLELVDFVLAHLDSEPVDRRAALCRRLAVLSISADTRAALSAQAETLESVAEDNRQLLLNLRGGAR